MMGGKSYFSKESLYIFRGQVQLKLSLNEIHQKFGVFDLHFLQSLPPVGHFSLENPLASPKSQDGQVSDCQGVHHSPS